MEFLKSQALKISVFFNALLIIALSGAIVYFVVLGKGIIINNTSNSTSNSISNSYASSGSLAIGYIGGDARGKWDIQSQTFKMNANTSYFTAEQSAIDFAKTLDPIQFINTKIVYGANEFIVIYPVITTVTDETHKTKKIVNGIEVK